MERATDVHSEMIQPIILLAYIKSDSKRKAQPNELAVLRPFLAIVLATTLIFLIKLRF